MSEERRAELTTRRCLLRPLAVDDATSLHALWSSPGVRRFLWDDEIISLARTVEALERSERLFHEQRFGLWGATPRGASNLVGFAGLWPFREPPEIELLYGVEEHAWGRGFATEIAQAVVKYCFESLGMAAVRASTDPGNAASSRVLEKLGFRLVRRDVVGGLDTVFYELAQRAC
jgi:ribosomal-protein-alanine N-acetyltransferase